MKKPYETPTVDVVKFEYKDQIVVASGGNCTTPYGFSCPNSSTGCTDHSQTGPSHNQ